MSTTTGSATHNMPSHTMTPLHDALSHDNASTRRSRSRMRRSLSRYFNSRGTSTLAVPLPHLEAPLPHLEAPPFLRWHHWPRRRMSSHPLLPLHAVPAFAWYVLSRGTHLSCNTPLFCGSATGSSMPRMSSHTVRPLHDVRALACGVSSRGTCSLAVLPLAVPLPHLGAPPFLR